MKIEVFRQNENNKFFFFFFFLLKKSTDWTFFYPSKYFVIFICILYVFLLKKDSYSVAN